MLTVGDYSSLSEVGIGVNLAITYINVFVEPSISRAEKQILQFKWWTEVPDRLGKIRGRELVVQDFEEALSEWSHEFDLMEDAIRKHRKVPTYISVGSAALLCVGLFMPNEPISHLGICILGILAFVPVLGGAAYVWFRTYSERQAERKMASRASKLLATPSSGG